MRISHKGDESLSQILNTRTKMNGIEKDLINRAFIFQSLHGKNKRPQKKIPNLRQIIKKHKVEVLKNNFISKARLNSIYRNPTQNIDDLKEQDDSRDSHLFYQCLKSLQNTEGLALGNVALTIWSFTNILQITLMVFIFSIMMAFQETTEEDLFLYFRIFSVILYIIDMTLNFVTKRFQSGKQLKNIRQIGQFYLQNGFIIDLSSILIFPVALSIQANITPVTTIMALIKLWNNVKKFQKFQYIYINSTNKEQYYGLVKVFLTNFAIGHFLSIILNLMADLDKNSNWYYKLDIQSAEWYVKYIWGYYWGTNIMLTVGFGDLSATNYLEAIVLIFIETFSCITLAYNISYVGALIGSIRQTTEQKKKKLKYFHRMCQQNQISSQLETKLTNFIEESYEIKENFEYDEYDEVLETLPKDMQLQYRKQANQILFDGLGFLNYLSKRSMLKMAEVVERKICHPNQVILRKGSAAQFMILQKGCINLVCRHSSPSSSLNGKVIEKLQVQKKDKPKVLSLDFIKNKAIDYDIKSEKYSILYVMNIESFKDSLKGYQIDYQLFCTLRDRDQYLIGIQPCTICKTQYHNKFECSKLHFRPLKQMVIYKFLNKAKKEKAKRKFLQRRNKMSHVMSYMYIVENDLEKFISDNFNQEEKIEISRINDYQKKSKRLRKKTVLQRNMEYRNTQKFDNEKALKRIQELLASQNENQFWDIETDEAFNFRYYFWKDNPDRFEQGNKLKFKKNKYSFINEKN